MNEQYLWDGEGSPNPELRHIEEELRQFRWPRRPLRALNPRRSIGPWFAVAASIAGLAIAVTWFFWSTGDSSSLYRLEVLAGEVRVERASGELAGASNYLLPGERVLCGEETRARVLVGDIGHVELEPNSRMMIKGGDLGEREGSYQLYLENGTLAASIFAAPRLFWLETPAAIAVDLGCIYTATVNEDTQTTLLAVVSGQVSFEAAGRKVFVPTGAMCEAYPIRGPGTPYWTDSALAYRQAIAALDQNDGDPRKPLDVVLAAARPKDTLTLWHLLDHADSVVREAAFDKLAAFSPPPRGVDRAGVLSDDPTPRERWKDRLEAEW